jgi:hypothetical protein
MMSLALHSCAALLLFSAVSRAAFVSTSNFDEFTGRQLPITTAAGVSIHQGGIVQIGTFDSADVAALIGALPSATGMNALLDEFIPVGTPTTIGAEFSGLFFAGRTVPIEMDSILVGKPIVNLLLHMQQKVGGPGQQIPAIGLGSARPREAGRKK